MEFKKRQGRIATNAATKSLVIELSGTLEGRLEHSLETIVNKFVEELLTTASDRSESNDSGNRATEDDSPKPIVVNNLTIYDDGTRIQLIWCGKEIPLTDQQSRVFRRLYERTRDGFFQVSYASLMEGESAGATRVVDVFKKTPLWGTVIIPGQTKGSCKLNPAADPPEPR